MRRIKRTICWSWRGDCSLGQLTSTFTGWRRRRAIGSSQKLSSGRRPRERGYSLIANGVRFGTPLAATPYPYGPLFRVLALTDSADRRSRKRVGANRTTAKLWSIPPERMKGQCGACVPLTARSSLSLRDCPSSIAAITCSRVSGRKPMSGFNHAKRALDAKMLAELGELPPFVLHDQPVGEDRTVGTAGARSHPRIRHSSHEARPAQSLRSARLHR